MSKALAGIKPMLHQRFGWLKQYRNNIYFAIFGVAQILLSLTPVSSTKDVVRLVAGAFIVGASSYPLLQWIKQQWESQE